VILLTPQYTKYLKPLLNQNQALPCQIKEQLPHYLVLKVTDDPDADIEHIYAELHLPHHAVVVILAKSLQKTMGFQP
jgi:hypothetical protein